MPLNWLMWPWVGRMADSVIRKGKWVNVHTGEIIADTDVAISGGRIAFVGPDASHAIGKETKVIEANGRYMVPGLCGRAYAC